jgi:hypothetical protein
VHPLIEEIERGFMPSLEQLASEMRQQFPDFKFNVWRGPVGALTENPGYDLGVECVFPRHVPNVSDNVALIVEFCDLTTKPRFTASVGWGHPSSHLEAELGDWHSTADWPVATPRIVKELRDGLPRLVRAFQLAVSRGAPSA